MSTETAAPAAAAAPAAPAGGSSAPTAAAAAAPAAAPIPVNAGAPGSSAAAAAAAAAQGNPGGKWSDSFDSDTKDYLTQKGFTDPKAVVDSYRNLEKLRGVPQDRLLKLPDATAASDDPAYNEIYSKLGKPATPEGYGLKPKDPNQPGFTNWARDAFHKMNLTTAQGQALVKEFNAFNESQDAAQKAEHKVKIEQQSQQLKKDWGAAYDQNIRRAQAAARQFGIPDKAIDSLEQSIGFDGVMKLFDRLGTQVGEHSFVGGDGSQNFGEGTVLTPDQANARIKALKNDSEFAGRYLKGEVKARQEMDRLMRMANP